MSSENMILRSFHVPQKLDNDLKALAYELGVSKADIIRRFIADGMADITKQYGARLNQDAIRQLAEKVKAPAGSDAALLAEAISAEIDRGFPRAKTVSVPNAPEYILDRQVTASEGQSFFEPIRKRIAG